MRQILIILIPVILLGIFMAGGFTGDPIRGKAPLTGIFELTEKVPGVSQDVLQIQNLVPRQVATIPTNTPSINPTPTPTPGTSCTPTTKVAIDLLLDTSGSMCEPDVPNCLAPNTKINKLKDAVTTFAQNFTTGDLIGIHTFDSDAEEILQIGPYNAPNFAASVQNLRAFGCTMMEAGFIRSRDAINNIRNNPAYSDYNLVLIVLSDGVPTRPTGDIFFGGCVIPDATQNPEAIADQLKPNTRVITIGLDLSSLGEHYNLATNILRGSASEPSPDNPAQKNYFEDVKADDLESIYQSIAGEIRCL